MKPAETRPSASFARSALTLLWVLAFGGLVTWAGCGSNVVGSSSSSGMSECPGNPYCPFYNSPSPNMPCPTPGACCLDVFCTHNGGLNDLYYVCSDAGIWQLQP
jgi:hypothetical protein